MTIHLPEPVTRSINEAVQSGRFASVDDAIAAAWVAFNARTATPSESKTPGVDPSLQAKPIWEEVLEMTADIPDAEWDKLPTDLAEQHDHYIYGIPKRPAS